MHRHDHGDVFVALDDAAQRTADRRHLLAQGFAAMQGDQDQAAVVGRQALDIHARLARVDDRVQRVDHRVAGDRDGLARDALGDQRGAGPLRRRAMQRGDAAQQAAVHFLGERVQRVVAAQAGLDVDHRHLLVERRQRGNEGRRCVALHHQHVRAVLQQQVAHAQHHPRGQFGQGLAVAHDVKIDIGRDAEIAQGSVEHGAVLPGAHDMGQEVLGGVLHGQNHGRQLDRLGSGTHDHRHLHQLGHCPPICLCVRADSDGPARTVAARVVTNCKPYADLPGSSADAGPHGVQSDLSGFGARTSLWQPESYAFSGALSKKWTFRGNTSTQGVASLQRLFCAIMAQRYPEQASRFRPRLQ